MHGRLPGLLLRALAVGGCPTTPDLVDTDGDGVLDSSDCDPDDADVYPAAPDEFGDDVDQNCDGIDGYDADGDGWAASPGPDCNDSDPTIHPDAVEIADNFVDEDCDGADLICDADGDGALAEACGGDDCDDLSATCSVPGDCADGDGDGVRLCDGDCDDAAPDVYPGAPDAPADGVDSDCDGED